MKPFEPPPPTRCFHYGEILHRLGTPTEDYFVVSEVPIFVDGCGWVVTGLAPEGYREAFDYELRPHPRPTVEAKAASSIVMLLAWASDRAQ